MLNKGPAVSPVIATALISVLVGGIIGFYGRVAQERDTGSASGGSQGQGGGMGKMGGGGGGGGMGKMGGGQQPTASTLLPRLVRNIDLIEKVQNKGLTPTQSQTIMPILKEIQSTDALTDKDCEDKMAKINAALTDEQKQVINSMTPQRGGGGGGFGGGGGMGKMGGGGGGPTPYPGPPAGAGKMGGGGGKGDNKPFSSERDKQALTDLMKALDSSGKK